MLHARTVRGKTTRFDAIILVAVLSVAVITVRASAQYTTAAGFPTFATSFPVEMGFTNVSNGNIHIEIPLASFKQRGAVPYNARLVYDSLIWKIVGTTWQATNIASSMGGWRLITGGEPGTVTSFSASNPCDTVPITYRTSYSSFTWAAPDGTTHRFPITTMKDRTACAEDTPTGSAMTDDSSGYFMSVTNYTSATVYAPDGTQVYPTVKDTNGNAFSKDGSGNIIDTLGRTPIQVSTNGSTITYAVLNPQGGRTNITVTTTTVTANTSFGKSGVTECSTSCTFTAIQSIAFTDGSTYSFTYDSGASSGHFGELATMKLPTGSTITYGYTTFADGLGNRSRWLSSKVVGASTWNFTPLAQGQTAQQVTVGEPTGDSIIYSFALNNGAWVSGANYVDATRGSLLSVSESWDTSQSCPYSGCSGSAYIRKLTEKTQLPGGKAKTVTYAYVSPQNGQIKEIDESDWSTGTPPILRKTVISYASPGGTNILDRPSTVKTQDASSVTKAETDYTYDSHGNALTVKKWTSGSNWLTTTYTYNTTGTVATIQDPNTTTTTIAYNGSGYCGDGTQYPTTISTPVNGHTLTRSIIWNCYGGVPTLTADYNSGNNTTYSYDSMWRLYQVNFPDGGQTTTTYSIVPNASTISTSRKMNSATSLTTVATLDGLGRAIKTQITSDLDGAVTTDTSYDALGRVASVSNPYRSTGDPTYGTTQNLYDVLGRVTKVTNPDASTRIYNYTGAAASIQDEGNGTSRVQRILQSDGLGRLTQVCEVTSASQRWNPNPVSPAACNLDYAGTGFLTTYGYDVLGNVTSVAQPPLNGRSFTYDGLSRLTSETNPEWFGHAITYSYNSNGDLYQRVRATPNQITYSALTTTYSFDSLHRMTGITYSNGTPSVTYNYDQATPLGIGSLYYNGRLTSEYTNSNTSSVYSYDQMGRVTKHYQCIDNNCTSAPSPVQEVDYAYDAMGDMTSSTFGNGVTLTYTYDGAARLAGITSSLVDTNHPGTLLSGPQQPGNRVQYNALGELTKAYYGNYTTTTGLIDTRTYDIRGRVKSIFTQTNTAGILSIQNTYEPNGNVATSYDSINQGITWTYAYDDFNRLATATGPGYSTLTMSYDRAGNRWSQTGPAGYTPSYAFDANSHIVGSGIDYDYAGNVMHDGAGNVFTYDAEGRVIAVSGASPQTYKYDAEGRRVQVGSEYFTFDLAGRAVAAYSSVWDRGEFWAGSQHLGTYSFGLTFFSSTDWLGNERVRSDQTLANYESVTNLPFGEATNSWGNYSGVTPIHYTGQEHDTESNLNHFLFRQQSPTEGRWMSPDPAGLAAVDPTNPQTWNRYAYVMNNPMNLVDPQGLNPPAIGQGCGTDPNCWRNSANNYAAQFWGGGGPRGNWSNYDSFSFFFNTAYLDWIEGGWSWVRSPFAVYSLSGNDIGNQPCTNYVMANCGAANNGPQQPQQPATQPPSTYQQCNQSALATAGPVWTVKSVLATVMGGVFTFVLPGGPTVGGFVRGASITQGSNMVTTGIIYTTQMAACQGANGGSNSIPHGH